MWERVGRVEGSSMGEGREGRGVTWVGGRRGHMGVGELRSHVGQ